VSGNEAFKQKILKRQKGEEHAVCKKTNNLLKLSTKIFDSDD
jgi:hypothetical protein